MPQNRPLTLVTVPCLQDNYAFLLHNEDTGETALVDAPEAAPIQAALKTRGWSLDDILITHHHDDHIQAVAALRGDARVIGAAADVNRLPPLDQAVSPRETITVCGEEAEILAADGHTVGHIAFHFPSSKLLFSADSLMALGCGRLFEGTAAQMWDTLSRFRRLPPDTIVCSGHEYTSGNAKFALSIDPDNRALQARAEAIRQARERGEPTVPSRLGDEIATNPFLRADDRVLKSAMGMPDASDDEVFKAIRTAKDNFR